MYSNFTDEMKRILGYSKEEAIRLGSSNIGTEHIFLAILRDGENPVIDQLVKLGLDLHEVKTEIDKRTKENIPMEVSYNKDLSLLKETERAIKYTQLEAMSFKNAVPKIEHLLLAILRDNSSIVTQVLNDRDITYETLKKEIIDAPKAHIFDEDDITSDEEDSENTKENLKKKRLAANNELDPVVGRETEIERLVQILSRRKKNNPVLIGEPGVGKSAIAEGLAIRIIKKKVSRVLFGKRIVTLDLAQIVAGTKYRGQFEERLKSILKELSNNKDIILFIDEIHTMVGAGGATGSLDAANMLKPALARGELQCIGATTLDEYRQHIEKDGALERRFQKIIVEPTSAEETVEILNNIKDKYESHHNVVYTDDAIDGCVKLTTRYVSDRNLPDKAIDALDEAGARVHISKINIPKQRDKIVEKKREAVSNQQFELAASYRDKEQDLISLLEKEKKQWEKELSSHPEVVDIDNVEKVVAMMTGVPVQRIAQSEGNRLIKMKAELADKVIGQDDAIAKIVKAIQRNRAGLKDPNKPIGSFVFLGPTGVGKTLLAKELSNYLFDSYDALIKIDMSEYMEKFAVSRLVGAPPGYVGYEEGGQLTEKVRRKPYSVVLLDEIEKAHPEVYNILLHMLDEGKLTDSLGRKVDFKNTIIIMTSNIGSKQIEDFGRGVGFSAKAQDDERNKSIIQKALKKTFSPEFLNRLDDVVVFESLKSDDIYKIIDVELKGLYKRVGELGYNLEISDKTKDFLHKKGYDSKFGARPIKRAIQNYLENEMSELIIESKLAAGDTMVANFDEEAEKVVIDIKKVATENVDSE